MSVAEWDSWLGDLTDAANRLEAQLAAGEPLAFPDLPPPPVHSDSPRLPSEHLSRAAGLLDRLERLERIAETQRDALHAQLHTLAVPRPRRTEVPSYELGAVFDAAG
ncbi:MAG: hypothetical protein QG622_1232 [Actinomycetota bacterium]|nr:hypothetical protein [Actinomycetota bacterium]